MNKRTVTIGPVFLVCSASIVQELQASQKNYPHLPDPTQLEVDINILNDESGVPVVVVNNEHGTHKLFLYTPSYFLALYETEAKNGYRVEHIEPVNVQMYDCLAQGALSLCATRWHLCTHDKEIPNSQSSHWKIMGEEWQLLQDQIQQLRTLARRDTSPLLAAHPLLPSHHEHYLDLVSSLIEITHQLKKATDDTLTSAQQAAISTLRAGKAANPYLLTALVDHDYHPYEVATLPLVAEKLSREQEEVIQKGLSVPDLLLVQAIPETEQIKAVTELIRACSAKRQHVLLATSTRQRLAALLAQLPAELLSLHLSLNLQADDSSSDNTGSPSAKMQARQMRQQILEQTEATLPPLSRLVVSQKTIDQWTERLQRHITTLSGDVTITQQVSALRQRMSTIEQFISTPYLPALSEMAASVQQLEENLTHQKNRLETVNERQAAAEELRQKPAIGRLFTSVDHLAQNWLKRQQVLLESLQAEYDTKKQAYQQAQETMMQVIREDPEHAWCQQRIQEIEAGYAKALSEATKAAAILQDTLRGLVPMQPPLEPANELTLQHYLNWYMVTKTLLEQRYSLLQEWRTQLSQYAEIVYPELLRYADVVAGTYPDILAAKELTQIEFDLVIVEDAGAMVLPDLLPLVIQARRAVLIGDPQQIPSFEQAAVQTLLQARSAEEEAQKLATHLTSSIFAQLWSSPIDAMHTVRPTPPAESTSGKEEESVEEERATASDDLDKPAEIEEEVI